MEMITSKIYRNLEQVSAPFEQNGKMYVKVKIPCSRCGGTGTYSFFGKCFKCNGVGNFIKTVRLYPKAELERKEFLIQKQKGLKEQELLKQSEKNKKEWLLKNGFSEEGFTWCVFGDNTYAIKEQLKQLGFKYNSLLKWHSPTETKPPENYTLIKVNFNDIATWYPLQKAAEFMETAEATIKSLTEKHIQPTGEYIGTIGERLRNLPVQLKEVKGFDGNYGYTYLYIFDYNNLKILWLTQKNLQIAAGSQVFLTGTVKKHELYKGTKFTYCNRCIVTPIEKEE